VLSPAALLVQADTGAATAAAAAAAATTMADSGSDSSSGSDSTASEPEIPATAPKSAVQTVAATAAATATGGSGSAPPVQSTSGNTTVVGRRLGGTVRAPVFSAVPATAAIARAASAAATAAGLMTASAAAAGNKHSSTTSSDADIDEADKRERAAYRADVQAAFARVSSGQLGSISLLQLPALLMALDMTFSEERHARALAALLDASDTVSLQRFSDWYVSWLMADGVSVTAAATSRDMTAVSETFHAQLKTAASGGWRCGSCYYMNASEKSQCVVCRLVHPEAVATRGAATSSSRSSSSSSSSSSRGDGFDSALAAAMYRARPAAVSGGFRLAPASNVAATASNVDAAVKTATAAATGGYSFTITASAAVQFTDDDSDFALDNVSSDVGSDAYCEQNEAEERTALRATVRAAFARVNSGQPGSISLLQLPALLMALDMTYSEERHARALAALLDADSGVALQQFSDWYESLVFADGIGISSDAAAAASITDVVRATTAVAEVFNAQLKTAAGGGWRCGSCCYMNSAEGDQCAMCSKPSPTATAVAAAAAVTVAVLPAAAAATAAAARARADSVSRSSISGFTFGGAFAAPTAAATAADTATTAATGGFSFTLTPAAATQCTDSDSDFAADDASSDADSQHNDNEERAAQCAIVAAAFATVSPSRPSVISSSQFPALLTALHVLSSEEWQTTTLAALLDVDGNVSLQRFSDWYIHWLFTDDESATCYDSIAAATTAAVVAAKCRRSFNAQFRPVAGSWRCECCYFTNSAEKHECAACEARNPAAAATAATADSGSISNSGFSYSARTAASPAVGTSANRSAFGSTSALAAPVHYTASAAVSGGFRFAPAAGAATQSTANGATAADTATTTAATHTATAATGFSFTPTFTPGTAAVLAAAAAVAAAPAAQLTEGAHDVNLNVDCVIDNTISDTDSCQEKDQLHVEERATIAAAFAKLNPSQPDVIPDSQFPALFEALGTTYSEAACAITLTTLADVNGNMSLQQVSDWYLQWLFDHDDDSSSSDSDSEYHDALAEAVAESRRDLSEQFTPAAGSWRCDCCYITNSAEKAQCAACEAPKH
jgi:hypothetical protein